jgi:hypothetical protein
MGTEVLFFSPKRATNVLQMPFEDDGVGEVSSHDLWAEIVLSDWLLDL